MDLPQEIELWHVIPMIRKLLVLDLKTQDLRQKEIASLLHITESAVSQYLKDKRAHTCTIKIPKDVQQAISDSAKAIRESGGAERIVVNKINSLSNLFKEKRLICKIHMKKDADLKDCNVCYE